MVPVTELSNGQPRYGTFCLVVGTDKHCDYTSYVQSMYAYIQFMMKYVHTVELFMEDTLGPANLSTVKKLSTLQR